MIARVKLSFSSNIDYNGKVTQVLSARNLFALGSETQFGVNPSM